MFEAWQPESFSQSFHQNHSC